MHPFPCTLLGGAPPSTFEYLVCAPGGWAYGTGTGAGKGGQVITGTRVDPPKGSHTVNAPATSGSPGTAQPSATIDASFTGSPISAQGGANGSSGTGYQLGGAGVNSSISGSSVTYGANGTDDGSKTPASANPNRGWGGSTDGQMGGNGVIIFRYVTGTANCTGGTITTSGLYTIHTFTGSGTLTIS